MHAKNKVTFLPASTTLANGETVHRGQLVEYYNGTARPYYAVIVDWSESGKTVTVHRCIVKELKDGTERLELYKTDGVFCDVRRVIMDFRFLAGRKGEKACFRKDIHHLNFDCSPLVC
jgi:hypothetical protein